MDRMELENGMNEREALDTESSKVVALLGALPRVEAPGDFDFGVKAKIAAGAPRSTASLLPFWKVAAPLGFVFLVAAFVIFNGTLPGDDKIITVAEVSQAEINTTRPVPGQSVEVPVQESGPQVTRPIDRQLASVSSEPSRPGPVRRTNRFEALPVRDAGSFDSLIKPANVISPPGFESSVGRNPNQNTNTNHAADIPVREILDTLGVKADFVNGGWTVRSTSDNSIATRSGVRSNDVIEAVNDQNLAERTVLKGNFEGKSISVRREGKQLKLDLKN